ncbi:MAG: hypothetical protein HWN65_23705, partial [Candidatus Helarchaeota archaeon]|nr:hypothetical protein [Candidatus Helarchaeota archaeon]
MNWKKIITVILIILFLASFMKMNPLLNPTMQNIEEPTLLYAKIHNLQLYYDWNYTGETFTGYARIYGNAIATFNYCSFTLTDAMEIYQNSTVIFNNCTLDLTSLDIYDNAQATFYNHCAFDVTSYIHIRQSANATTFEECSIDFTSLDIYENANATFRQCYLFDPPGEAGEDEDDDEAGEGDEDDEAGNDDEDIDEGEADDEAGNDDEAGDEGDEDEAGDEGDEDEAGNNGDTLNIYDNALATFDNCNLTLTALDIDGAAQVTSYNKCNFTISRTTSGDVLRINTTNATTFSGCTFNLTHADYAFRKNEGLSIAGLGKTSFYDCSIDAGSVLITGDATVTFNMSTIAVSPATAGDDPLSDINVLHRLNFFGTSKTNFNNSTVSCPFDSIVSVENRANVTIRNDSTFNVETIFRILNNATGTIDDSTMNAGAIFLANQQGYYKTNGTLIATLTVRNGAAVNGAIVDVGTNDAVSINESTVEIVAETYWVEGTLTIFKNGTVSGTDHTSYYNETFTIDETSNFTKQHAVLGLNESQIVIESPKLYGVAAAWDSTCKITNSTITDFVSGADLANLSLTDATILGKGEAALYGAVNGIVATYIQRTSGNCTSFISLHNCTIAGWVRPSGDMTIVLQRSSYGKIALVPPLTDHALVVERSGPDVCLSGWINNGTLREVTAANLTVNDASVPAGPTDPLEFALDPVTHQVPGLAQFDVQVFDNASNSFIRNFTIEIPSLAPQKQVFWNTTSDFQNYANNNCSIGTNNVTLTWVNATGIAYDFTNDSDGSNPAGWFVWEAPNTHMNVHAGVEDHAKVVEINDSATANTCYMIN